MKTKPWAPGPSTFAEFSASELSLAETYRVVPRNGEASRYSLLAAAYSAVLLFRAKQPFELWCDKHTEPLVSFSEKGLVVHPAIRSVIVDLDAICDSEVRRGIASAQGERQASSDAPPTAASGSGEPVLKVESPVRLEPRQSESGRHRRGRQAQ